MSYSLKRSSRSFELSLIKTGHTLSRMVSLDFRMQTLSLGPKHINKITNGILIYLSKHINKITNGILIYLSEHIAHVKIVASHNSSYRLKDTGRGVEISHGEKELVRVRIRVPVRTGNSMELIRCLPKKETQKGMHETKRLWFSGSITLAEEMIA